MRVILHNTEPEKSKKTMINDSDRNNQTIKTSPYVCISYDHVGAKEGLVQFSGSVVSDTFCNFMNHITTGFSIHHQLLEFTQTHVH